MCLIVELGLKKDSPVCIFLMFQIKNNVHENESIGEDEVILEFYEKNSDTAVQNKAA